MALEAMCDGIYPKRRGRRALERANKEMILAEQQFAQPSLSFVMPPFAQVSDVTSYNAKLPNPVGSPQGLSKYSKPAFEVR